MVSERLPEVANRVTEELFGTKWEHGVRESCKILQISWIAAFVSRRRCGTVQRRNMSTRTRVLILVSGFTAGNITRLVLPSSTIGARSHCPSPLPSTYLTLGRLPDHLPAAFSNGSPTSMELRSNLALSTSLRLCVTENHGARGARFDETGSRRTACARSQRLPARALPPETTLARCAVKLERLSGAAGKFVR